ncbi:hypothetical protein KKG29_03035 [Patescibacteria group bacterium]|nr:hypothetical protein [Patescibacteria group bacterium]MBU4000123.1 hypothetical protein [Patescibacteria group bacterium]MBU4057192.1 hypothetical protein [Patescibacteria group bacterium]MBU4368321.1 hypothetical protein [Patescibacteria group bacterium]
MEQFLIQNSWPIILSVAWTLPWKGVALWKAARLNDKWWFIALLVINTLALLEILYIFIFSKRKNLLVRRSPGEDGKSSPEV